MRKRLIALAFIAFLLCAPAFAGHTVMGGGWCPCGAEACICDPGELMDSHVSEPDKSTQDTPVDLGSETLLVLAALILVLRYKA